MSHKAKISPTTMATTSPLSIPHLLPHLPKPKKLIKLSSSLNDLENAASTSFCAFSSSSSFGSISLSRRRLFEVGTGFFASSLGVSDDAKATRVVYYATVGEPLCDMNFVKSGLGYCDVAVGTGVQPPPGELINMYPLIGMRYKCIDCKEAIGFDMCETCYSSSSKLPDRFNQQHTPDHTFKIDEL